MVNEWVYCPRLAYLEWVEGEWADSGDTEQGRRAHARVDKPGPPLASPEALEETEDEFKTRQVTLSSERLGVICKMDLLEAKDGLVVPIDYKKGKRPHVAAGAYEPERVQVCAQGLVLEDNGYRVEEGVLWFAGSRERVKVVFDEDLRARTLDAISGLRRAAAERRRPPPLENSPKCVRCSLAGICLPDEVSFFRTGQTPRPLNPSADPALPLYVQTPGGRVTRRGETLVVETPAESSDDPPDKIKVPLIDVSQLVLWGPVSVTTPALHELMRRDIPVTWHSTGGWFLGHTTGLGSGHVELREAQWRASFDEAFCLRFARALVAAKIANQRTMLRRNWKDETRAAEKEASLERLRRLQRRAPHAADTGESLGREGEAAAIYFRCFEAMIAPAKAAFPAFAFGKRNRRPPSDPVNALLSFAYALLTKTWAVTLSAVGFDVMRGFYHRPRHGRPALALDMMEPFRPILADSCVLTAINNGEVAADGFVVSGGGCALKPAARRAFIAAYERRLDQETTHPLFGYRVSLRRLLEVQARLLARHLQGEIDEYPHYVPR